MNKMTQTNPNIRTVIIIHKDGIITVKTAKADYVLAFYRNKIIKRIETY